MFLQWSRQLHHIIYNTLHHSRYTGNAIDFGDLSGTARGYGASFSSRTRGVFLAGQNGGTNQNNIDFVTISSTGTATAFGNIHDKT